MHVFQQELASYKNVSGFFFLSSFDTMYRLMQILTYKFKEACHDFAKILFFYLYYLQCFRKECISNKQMKFAILSTNKQDTGLTVICHVNKPRVLFLFT